MQILLRQHAHNPDSAPSHTAALGGEDVDELDTTIAGLARRGLKSPTDIELRLNLIDLGAYLRGGGNVLARACVCHLGHENWPKRSPASERGARKDVMEEGDVAAFES
ncbi:MAG: hypothetical protein M1829_000418 [Trizodia sp. TS-e1964]|nr:MAG: hypothetical protein M1829_000418 [Trizodia sp. TS-e1964]